MKGVYLEFVFHQSSTCLTFRKECTHEDGDATVTLTNAYMNFDSTNKPTVYVKAYYWNGTTWKRATVTPSSVKVSKNMATYTFNVTGISRGTAFYVKLSKTEYTGYKFIGNITISD